MKGQIFEMLFYPFFIFLIISFFTFSIDEILNGINATQSILIKSDNTIRYSNQLLLNSTLTHIWKNEYTLENRGTYKIRRLLVLFNQKTDKFFVKELIFPNPD